MRSRFLSKLESRILNAARPLEVGCLLAQKAAYYARLGNSVKSAEIIEELRRNGVYNIDGDVVCWINYAEGIIGHYSGNDIESRQKLERSRAVARTIGNKTVFALGSAWLAFSDYLSERLDLLAKNSVDAITSVCKGDFSTRSRVSLTLGLCYHFCGEYMSARRWYTECRLAAVEDGDEVMLAALIHDMAWMSTSNRRNQLLSRQAFRDEAALLAVNAESARSYESLIGSSTLPAMTPLLIAQIEIMNGLWESAVQKITENFAASRQQGFGRLQAGLLADRAYCFAAMGRFDESESDALAASSLATSELHFDDRAVLHSRLAQTFSLLNQQALQRRHEEMADRSWNELLDFKRQMLERVVAVESAAKSNHFI